MSWHTPLDISILNGKTITCIEGGKDDDRLEFSTAEGKNYLMYHRQDCCESVRVEDICGDLNDLLNTPVITAENIHEERERLGEWHESFTWTFYRIRTIKGTVTIRWYGTSNGYYSESVDFIEIAEGSFASSYE